MDLMEESCVNAGFSRTQEGPCKGIEIDGLRFINYLSFYTGHYSEIESTLEKEEPELCEAKDKDSTSNPSSSQETLSPISKAHVMDPDMVPDLLWKRGNIDNPKSDQVRLNCFPNLPEDVILIDEIPGFATEKENDIGRILFGEI
jgi:hypothetical protein